MYKFDIFMLRFTYKNIKFITNMIFKILII